jgi:hypothetical protein
MKIHGNFMSALSLLNISTCGRRAVRWVWWGVYMISPSRQYHSPAGMILGLIVLSCVSTGVRGGGGVAFECVVRAKVRGLSAP